MECFGNTVSSSTENEKKHIQTKRIRVVLNTLVLRYIIAWKENTFVGGQTVIIRNNTEIEDAIKLFIIDRIERGQLLF